MSDASPTTTSPRVGPVDRAYDHLLASLAQAPAGSRLPSERAVAAELGVSRQSVRAAFRRLHEAGRVRRVVGSGSFIGPAAEPSPGTSALPDAAVLDVLEARHILEPAMAALATSRATGDDFARIAEKLETLRQATEPGDYKQLGYAFWLEIARATRNPLLVAMYQMLTDCRARLGWDQLKGMTTDAGKRAAQQRLAEELWEALRVRDRERARGLATERTRNMLRAASDMGAAGPATRDDS